MSLINMDFVNSGRSLVVTPLWENPSKSSAFDGTNDISIADSYENYKFIKVTYKGNTSDANTAIKATYFAPEDLADTTTNARLCICALESSAYYFRSVRGGATTSAIKITACYKVNADAGTQNSKVIPLYIEGLK